MASVLCSKVFHEPTEKVRMIDDRNDSTHIIDEPEANLPPPRFDEMAAANAQPVKPIRTNRISALAGSFRQAVTSGSRALALVVIAGLATGTLVGMAWVKEPQATAESPSANHSVSELAPADPLNDSQNQQPGAEAIGVTGLQSASAGTGIRRNRSRGRSSRGARAYRVATLR
jgi:hypothetical protein